ncbi:MAG: hypothetical protein NC087_09645 [Anaeroplasma bactoclasticum]|nr:hypothetical protein [Anaeroplasma bactoclasticum]MCM1557770.1 hypothetical protein [Anaeroplasma bactoclasticum]
MSIFIEGIVVAKSRKNSGYCVVVFDLEGMYFIASYLMNLELEMVS